jgi:hypothetical protein
MSFLFGVERVSRLDHWLVVLPLDWDGSAMHSSNQFAGLEIAEVASNRLGRDIELTGQVGDVDRSGA